ncbi:MAG: hypothetical protein WKF92_09840 [Pyrinomonadaceae bacterium]
MNVDEYYALPIFESTKSTHVLRCRNEYEKALMQSYDANPKILDYFQPLMEIVVNDANGIEVLVLINFWLAYENDRTVLVHLADSGAQFDDLRFEQAARFCCKNSMELVVVLKDDTTKLTDSFLSRLGRRVCGREEK